MIRSRRPAGREKRSRFVRTLLIGFIAAGFLVGSSPASAGSSAAWKDPENDANEQGLTDGAPNVTDGVPNVTGGVANEPAFDVTDVTLETVGDKFRWTVKVPRMTPGAPSSSTDYYFRLRFTHYGAKYWFIVAETRQGGKIFALMPLENRPKPEMKCHRCKGSISRQAKAVVVEAPIASLNAAFAAVDAPPVDGEVWSDLSVWSQRHTFTMTPFGGQQFTKTADTANAPKNTVFRF